MFGLGSQDLEVNKDQYLSPEVKPWISGKKC